MVTNVQLLESTYTKALLMVIQKEIYWYSFNFSFNLIFNPLTPNDPYRGRTPPLTSKCCILYIYSTNIGTEYFKHGIYSPLFSLQNAVCVTILTYLVPVLFTFYIQVCKNYKNNSNAKKLSDKVAKQKRQIFVTLHNKLSKIPPSTSGHFAAGVGT